MNDRNHRRRQAFDSAASTMALRKCGHRRLESTGRWDYYEILRTIPGDQAFLPLSESQCPLVNQ
jgi:hypothetical protein